MTREREIMFKSAGWISVEDELPPLGEEVEVCQADEYTQSIWCQTFKSLSQIEEMKITHWNKLKLQK